MTTKTASKSRTGNYTSAHKCRNCGKAFWTDPSWNRVTVKCPHCGSAN